MRRRSSGLISSGKEADVYLARYGGAPIAIKSYRLYRTSHRGGGPIKLETMGWLAAHEFEMMRQAWKGGARVPAPARRVENMFSLRYLGGLDGPAPRLQDVRLENPQEVLEQVLTGVTGLARAGIVHGDLSAFNILVSDDGMWLIDFSESMRVDRTGAAPWRRLSEARLALVRGMNALSSYFRRYHVRLDAETFVDGIIASRDRFGVATDRSADK